MTDVVITVDCMGEACPLPLIKLAKAVAAAPPGAVIEVLNDDEASKADIPVWCRMKGHEFLRREDRGTGWAYFVRA